MQQRLRRGKKKYKFFKSCGVYYERKLKKKGFDLIVGIDEAGRGPLAGPVVAAAVILKTTRFKNRIDDSKKLTPLQREVAFQEILNKSFFGLGIVDEKIIDAVNILRATCLAMELAVKNLMKKLKFKQRNISRPHMLIDGNVPLSIQYPFTNVVNGDARSRSIASASILAKVTRDKIMASYHKLFPEYNFIKHKGYPTKEHKKAIHKFGLSDIHRKTFSHA